MLLVIQLLHILYSNLDGDSKFCDFWRDFNFACNKHVIYGNKIEKNRESSLRISMLKKKLPFPYLFYCDSITKKNRRKRF